MTEQISVGQAYVSRLKVGPWLHAGPAVSTDTACSSAVVATHLGLQHTASHGGSVLTAGVNLMLAETTTAAAHAAGAKCAICKTLLILLPVTGCLEFAREISATEGLRQQSAHLELSLALTYDDMRRHACSGRPLQDARRHGRRLRAGGGLHCHAAHLQRHYG